MVADFVSNSSLYVYENDDLLKVIEHMKKFNIDNISVVSEDFLLVSQLKRENVKEYIKKNFFVFGNIFDSLKNIKVKDIINKSTMPLVFYPETQAEHAFSVMKYLNNKYAPVVKTPLDKKVIGFIWLNDKYKQAKKA